MLPAAVLLDLLEQKPFAVEYQPLVSSQTSNIIGYEALARFHTLNGRALAPDAVFESLHNSPLSLFQLELAMKIIQIELAPKEGLLFLNLDPHAAQAWGELSINNPLIKALCKRKNTVIELIENTSISDAQLCAQLTQTLKSEGTLLALDDLGAADSMLSFQVLETVDIIKLDRSWTQRLNNQKAVHLLKSIIEYAQNTNKLSVLEGVETEEQARSARNLGVDYLQGYLFKPQFIYKNKQ